MLACSAMLSFFFLSAVRRLVTGCSSALLTFFGWRVTIFSRPVGIRLLALFALLSSALFCLVGSSPASALHSVSLLSFWARLAVGHLLEGGFFVD
jgi:hypothetical protein